MKLLRSYSSKETKQFGKVYARRLRVGRLEKHARVVALKGELGAGKTTFVQGFARGLGLKKRMVSPTFIIMRRFKIGVGYQASGISNFYHIDAYRIKKPREISQLGFKDILKNRENVVLIEWADKIKKVLPKGTMWLTFHHGKKENERLIEI